ncbi:MAG TPA: hypothetical protein VHM90_22695, partial [Phycisphaerae bacterium]|nr:hypothetical protein [Phycisphaerae bacterium]
MPKRIALFILGVVLAVGAFLIYQLISGPGAPAPKKAKLPVPDGPVQAMPMTIEERDPTGRLIYLITAPKAPEPMKDAAGNVLPGQFHIASPIARFYDKGGRMYQVEADNCDIAVAGLPGGGAAAAGGAGGGLGALAGHGGKAAIKLDQIAGSLYGHARMSIGARPAGEKSEKDALKDPFANGVRIYFDGPVKLDGASQQLKSDDFLHIRSDTIEADQKELTAVFDQKSRHILSLHIGENPQGNQIIVRNMADKAMQMMEGKEKSGGGGTTQATQPSTRSGPQVEKDDVPIYRLTFGQDVVARAGVSSMSAQGLALIFSPTQSMLGENATKPATATASAPAMLPINVATPGMESIPQQVGPIQPAGKDDLVITWAGPLEMLPVDPKEMRPLAPDEIILDAMGTAAKPVTIKKEPTTREAGFETILGKLQYDSGHPILLLPDEYKKVLLRRYPVLGGGGFVSDVECGKVTLTQVGDKHYTAELLGPGTLTDQRKDKDGVQITSVVKWKTRMAIDLVPDPSDAKGKDLVVRSAEFDGASIAQNGPKGFEMTAANMSLLLAYAKPYKDPALEHMLATGDVKVYRKGIKPEDQGELFANRLEILSTPAAAGKLPTISTMLADGNVTSWRYSGNATASAATIAAASAPATGLAAADPADSYRKEKLSAGKFAATLIPNPNAAPPPSVAAATAPATQSAIDTLASSFDVEHFVAQQNVKLEVIPPVHSRREIITASGDMIDSFPIKGTSVITAPLTPDGKGGVRVTRGTDVMVSARIDLQKFDKSKDIEAYYEINCPGAGTFHFTIPPNGAPKQPTPLDITWQNKMSYDGANALIV